MPGPHRATGQAPAGTGSGSARLDSNELDQFTHHLFLKGLASSTQRAYRSAQKRYGDFCARDGRQAVPASEEGLCRFVARLAGDGLKHRTIKSYLSGVRHLHIEEGLPDPFIQPLHRLHYTLRGLRARKVWWGESGYPSLLISCNGSRRYGTRVLPGRMRSCCGLHAAWLFSGS